MYFRFGVGILLIVAVSVAGVAIEKSTMSMRRDISRQHFRMDVLHEQQMQLRLQTQQLRSPRRMIESMEAGRITVERPHKQSAHNTPRKKKRR